MNGIDTTFEIRVRNNGSLGMKHVQAKDHKSAKIKGKRYGHVVSVRKADITHIFGNIENLELNQMPLVEYVKGSHYESAIAMDEMIWNKRNKRIKNKEKDKDCY